MSEPMSGPALPPNRISRIILTGFMGAGKSTAGTLLAQRLGWPFADSDHVLEARAGTSIAEIFRRDGEAAFRQMEAATIHELTQRAPIVLALGGGAVETPSTQAVLRSLRDTCIVFLEAPLEVLVARCLDAPEGPVRPVLADRERLEQRFAARLPFYREAHLTVPTRDLAPEAVVERILRHLLGHSKSLLKEGANA
jgi:shikimate kinase